MAMRGLLAGALAILMGGCSQAPDPAAAASAQTLAQLAADARTTAALFNDPGWAACMDDYQRMPANGDAQRWHLSDGKRCGSDIPMAPGRYYMRISHVDIESPDSEITLEQMMPHGFLQIVCSDRHGMAPEVNGRMAVDVRCAGFPHLLAKTKRVAPLTAGHFEAATCAMHLERVAALHNHVKLASDARLQERWQVEVKYGRESGCPDSRYHHAPSRP